MKSKGIPPKNASERAYKAIKAMISQYQLMPSQKITYIQLSEKLKMSKTPIINALHRLEQEEFVLSLPNRGFFVKEIDIEEVAELFKVREAL
ncbi:MAG: GntR family transcriptional regulator, partial [Deltaproteobacteria bacterium]|nr:GntR family transcriptional regulator [Deltaproteobacteria bacterium]